MEDPAKFPHLFHPELRTQDRTYVVLRSSMWSKWWYPVDQQVGWFGSAIRDIDGGNGMYCTLPQFETWPHRTVSDVKIGPG